MRQSIDPRPGISVSTLAWDYAPDFNVPEHSHKSDQLIYATCGVMEVFSGQTCWFIPPHFGVWIPARVLHRIRMKGAVSMRTLYLRRNRGHPMPDTCEVRRVSPLLRELILESVRLRRLRYANSHHRALRDLILHQLAHAAPISVSLTLPNDPRALAVAQALLDHAQSPAPLRELCERSGASVRTIERIFAKELGVSIETWRRQMRLMKAMERMVSGIPVKQIAFELGYRQASPFIEMFRRTLGMTPRAWLTENAKI
jgi:AraC-like DNA-binding protein